MTALSCKGCLFECIMTETPIAKECPCATCIVKVNCSEVCAEFELFWKQWKEKYNVKYIMGDVNVVTIEEI